MLILKYEKGRVPGNRAGGAPREIGLEADH